MSELLKLVNVSKDFVTTSETLSILSAINIKISRGDTIAITGPSGSGKSTLLGLMAGLERPTCGEIYFQDDAVHEWDEDRLALWRRQAVGFIFQNFRLVKTLNALENVTLPLEILGHDLAQGREQAMALLTKLEMNNRASHFPHQLSGGEQQRIAIARAYVHQPQIIFADEPTGSLDTTTAEKVLNSLLEINRQQQTALIVVTHDRQVAQTLSHQLQLTGGRIS